MSSTDPVRSQYTRWVYPEPKLTVDDVWENLDPNYQHLHFAYWPDRPYQPHMRILVAGCGSNQAAHIAYRNPSAHVVGIDISDRSLAHEKFLKEKFSLSNLRLECMPIEQAGTLGAKFDLIVACGVLHHLADPAASLATLGSLLEPDGVVAAMVYGRYLRTGVYMLQDLFRRVGLGQSSEDVAVVRQTLANLPLRHLARNYILEAPDLGFDAGIVDTFLHPVDRAYTVTDCLDLVAKAGLRFQGWVENNLYYPNGQMSAGHPLFPRVEALPERELWAAMELHHGGIGKHAFFCCRTDRAQASFHLDFESEIFYALIPVLRNARLVQPSASGTHPAAIVRDGFPESGIDHVQLRLLQCIDGVRSIERCIADCDSLPGTYDQRRAFGRQVFVSLWRLGYVLLRA